MGSRLERAVLTLLRAPNFDLTVLSVDDSGPGFRRLRFGAPELIGRVQLHPSIWLRLWFPDGPSTVQRAYTITQVDLNDQTFAIDFVLHEPDGAATAWVRRATVGDRLAAMLYAGAPFAFADPLPPGYLLVGDTASLPAISEIVAAAPAGSRLRVLLVAAHEHDRQYPAPVNGDADVHVQWVDGHDPAVLTGAIDQSGDLSGWHFWVALEAGATKQVRAQLKRRWSPGRHDLKAQAYWIRGRSMGTATTAAADSQLERGH